MCLAERFHQAKDLKSQVKSVSQVIALKNINMSRTREQCDICQWDDKNDVMYGDWMTSGNIKVHYFCLLSSSYIAQEGTSAKSGILGFLLRDISQSKEKFSDILCCYCGRASASIKCAHPGCDRSFHYPCGTRNSCMTEFLEEFKSYCHRHVPDRQIDLLKPTSHTHGFCLICCNPMGTYHPATSIMSSCCAELEINDNLFTHKECLMAYTKNAGHDAMCPHCVRMKRPQWQHEMSLKGIFIPKQKAKWEDDDFYEFKKQVKNKCGHSNCPYSKSRHAVFTCFVCGCFPLHLKCAKVSKHQDYYCPKCFDQSFVSRITI